jgi:hypothetical protein
MNTVSQQIRCKIKEASDSNNMSLMNGIPPGNYFLQAFNMKLYNVLEIFKNDSYKNILTETVTFLFKQNLIEGNYPDLAYLKNNFNPFIDWQSYFPTWVKENRNRRRNENDDGIYSEIYDVQKQHLKDMGFFY